MSARKPHNESERIVARLNALCAIRRGELRRDRASWPRHLWPGAVDEACELGYAEEPYAAGDHYQLTEHGEAFVGVVGE
jgi:hypothetical protein